LRDKLSRLSRDESLPLYINHLRIADAQFIAPYFDVTIRAERRQSPRGELNNLHAMLQGLSKANRQWHFDFPATANNPAAKVFSPDKFFVKVE
jgi:hypothetical protein